MAILEKLFILFLFIYPTGVLARIQFSSGIAISLNDLVLLVLIISWLSLKIKNKKFNKRYHLFKPIGIFLSICLLSLVLNFSNLGLTKFLISFSYLFRYICYLLLYFIALDFSNNFKEKIYKYLMFIGLLVIGLGYFQYLFYPSLKPLFYLGWDEHLYRMVSIFLDPNFAGTFFNIYFIISLEFLRKYYKSFTKFKIITFYIISLLTLISIYLTYSRSALIMLFISVVTYLILLKKNKLIALALAGLILLIFISPRAFQTEGTNLLRVVSTTERISSFQIATKVVQLNPIFGVGFNAYRYAQNKLGLEGIYWQVTHSGAGTDASLLFVLATTGFIGLSAFIYLLFKIIILSVNNLNKNGIILLSVLIGLIFNSLFVNSLFYVLILEWVWILTGLTESS